MYNTKTLTYTLVCVVGFFFAVVSSENIPKEWTRAIALQFGGPKKNEPIEFQCTKARNSLISAMKFGAPVGAVLAATGGAAGLAVAGVKIAGLVGAGATTLVGAGVKASKRYNNKKGKQSRFGGLETLIFQFRIERACQLSPTDDDDKRRVYVRFTNSKGSNVRYAELDIVGAPEKKSQRIKFVLKCITQRKTICDRWIWYGQDSTNLERVLKAIWAEMKRPGKAGRVQTKIKNPKKASSWKPWKTTRWNRGSCLKNFQGKDFDKSYWNKEYFGIIPKPETTTQQTLRRISSRIV